MEPGERERLRAERRRLRKQYRDLFDQVSAILFRLDPIHISAETNQDEYEPEAGTILPRLREAASPVDVRRIVHEEFVRWFGEDIAGPEQRYEPAAADIWKAWQRHQETSR